jgi:hypothetical protein
MGCRIVSDISWAGRELVRALTNFLGTPLAPSLPRNRSPGSIRPG